MTVTYRDPRLAHEGVLRLAVYRLTHGPRPLPDRGEAGLAALLERARQLPPCEPADLAAARGPFAQLLREARQWGQEQTNEA